LWGQIAARYAGWPGRLYFELLNEPRDAMTAEAWNELIPLALAVIRERDPGRAVIVGPARMNDIGALPELDLPADDRLVVGVHYYSPLEFTHQGAPWRAGADQWLGATWGDDADQRAVRNDLAVAAYATRCSVTEIRSPGERPASTGTPARPVCCGLQDLVFVLVGHDQDSHRYRTPAVCDRVGNGPGNYAPSHALSSVRDPRPEPVV
jgi:hypothetical protein